MNVGSPAAAANISMPRFSSTATNIGKNIATNVGAAATATTGFLSGWVGIAIVLVALVILFAVYYQTIGYYIQIGWNKLKWSHDRGERVDIDVPGPVDAILSPASGSSSAGSAIGGISGAISNLESDVEAALSGVTDGKQVFNISRNLYTFEEAEPLCRAFGAELATYDQVKAAYERGADWCNYGWTKGQLAVYPTQKDTYEKLQHGPEDQRMSCGVPGVNGGYFPNADQRFGVNCYGSRPAESAIDERMQATKADTAYDREVSRFKAELDSIAVSPWNAQQWSA